MKRVSNKTNYSSPIRAKIDLSQKLGGKHDVGGIVIPGKFIECAVDRGGKAALEQITAEVKNATNNFIITADGSRGPRHKMKVGALIVAQKAQVPLYLLRASYPAIPIIFSWDKHRIPLPFAGVQFYISDAIRIDTNADKIQINQKISECEHFLNRLGNY